MLNDFVMRLLWKWAVRRHPTKGMAWVRRRYFRTEGDRTWVFATEIEVDGHVLRLRLFGAATIPIVRHVSTAQYLRGDSV